MFDDAPANDAAAVNVFNAPEITVPAPAAYYDHAFQG